MPKDHPSLNTPDGVQAFQTSLMRMVVLGYTRQQISMEFKMDIKRVDYHINLIMNELRQQALEDVQVHYGRELQHLFLIRQEAWDAWEKSKKKRIRSKVALKRSTRPTRDGVDVDPEDIMVPASQEQTVVETDGDPRFLQVASQTTSAIIKLVGIEKAVQLLNQVNVINVSEASDEFNDRLARFRQQYNRIAAATEGALSPGGGLPGSDRLPESLGAEEDRPDRETS